MVRVSQGKRGGELPVRRDDRLAVAACASRCIR
jgi:hypothetical protein